MNRTVLISGATGDTGRSAVAESIKLGLSVRALVRRNDARSAALEQLGAEVVVGDLQNLDAVRAAMEGVDAAYFVYPVAPGLVSATAYFIQAAREAGVGSIVNLSQRSASRSSHSSSSKDHYVAEQLFDHSGLNVIHLRPTYFLDWLFYPWQLPLFLSQGIIRMPGGKGRHAPIAAEDQARVIAALLKDPSGHIGNTYPLFGPVEMDHVQMAAELSEALGRKIVFEDISIDAYAQSIAAMGVPEYVVKHLSAAFDDYQRGVMSGMNDNVERLSGQKPMGVAQFARKHIDRLNPAAL